MYQARTQRIDPVAQIGWMAAPDSVPRLSAKPQLPIIVVREHGVGGKLAKYARAGIRRYWVADIPHRILYEYRDPDRFGARYRQLRSLGEGSRVISIEGAEIRVEVADLFPG